MKKGKAVALALSLAIAVTSVFLPTSTAKAAPRNSNFVQRAMIDVSKYQQNIDWPTVKAAGIDYVIIRVGYRNHTTGAIEVDPLYTQNISGALAAGLNVGVYFRTEAVNPSEAIEEAQWTINMVAPYNITLPIAIDFEPKAGDRAYGLDVATNTINIDAFCTTIQNSGYAPMVYSYRNGFTQKFDGSALAAKYLIWSASNPPWAISDFWQYGQGYVPGIPTLVDLDTWFDDGSLANYAYGAYKVVFNPTFYADANVDLKKKYGYDAKKLYEHFLKHGMAEGRCSSPTFNVRAYRAANPDLDAAYGDNWTMYFIHYINVGQYEGRVTI